MPRTQTLNANMAAFLDTIAVSEIGRELLANSDDGYNVLVGGELFEGYDDHPRIKVDLPHLHIYSTAAGRYQILARFYDAYKKQLDLPDFSPESQDKIAIQLIRECRAIDEIESGNIRKAIILCSSRWASFPGAGYGQHENSFQKLLSAFTAAGGRIADVSVEHHS